MYYTVSASNITAETAAQVAAYFTGIGIALDVWATPLPETGSVFDEDPVIEPGATNIVPFKKKAKADKKKFGTLVDHILKFSTRAGGVARSEIKTYAVANGFNPGSVSPTLVKLLKDKRIKRVGKGEYAATAKTRAAK